ncbi:uncharacterized protein LOC113531483, partial [Tachysurus ichikawai]
MHNRLSREAIARIAAAWLCARFAPGEKSALPRGSGPALAEAKRRRRSWGSQVDLAAGLELDESSPASSGESSSGTRSEAGPMAASPGASSAALHVSPSEEGELMDASEPVGPSQPVLYEELLKVVTRAVARLDLDWPVEQQKQRTPSKPRCPDPGKPHTLCALLLVTLRSTRMSSGLRRAATGQCRAYQADLLRDLDEGLSSGTTDIEELCPTAGLTLRATKHAARAVGRSMVALVDTERHLWLTLSNLPDKDRDVLLGAPMAPPGLFGDAVTAVVHKFRESKQQSAAFQQYLPR